MAAFTGDDSTSRLTRRLSEGKLFVQQATAGSKHTYSEAEATAFGNHINSALRGDQALEQLLPIQGADALFGAVENGLLLCKLINRAKPDTIDERALNSPTGAKGLSVFQRNENNNLAINAAKAIGCRVVNVGTDDIAKGVPHLVLGLVWQIIRVELLAGVNLKEHPELLRLLEEGEELEQLLALPPDQILLRWINYHLKNAKYPRRASNFGADLADSEIYTVLLHEIAPAQCSTRALAEADLAKRALAAIDGARSLGVDAFIAPQDIVQANSRLNLAFCAQIFNTCPGLSASEAELYDAAGLLEEEDEADSREERVFRHWINSLGIEGVFINNLYADLADGVVLLKLEDRVEPGVVSWKRVNNPPRNKFKRVENCNYAVLLGKQLKFSLVGIGGVDILDGKKKLILALVWQLMRLYKLKLLSSITKDGTLATEADVLRWANATVKGAAKDTAMASFRDPTLANGIFLLDLLCALAPGAIDWDLVAPGVDEEERAANAKYVISVTRKIGCAVFLGHEDVTEVKPKMLFSFCASLMAWQQRKQRKT